MKLNSIRHYSPGSRSHMKRDPRITQRLAWRAKVRRMLKQVLGEQQAQRRKSQACIQIIPAPKPHPEIHWLPENYFRAPLIPNRNYW